MVTKQNPEAGPDQLWALLEDDGRLVMLEGRPALFEDPDHAERARKRTSRPARVTVHPVDRLDVAGKAVVPANAVRGTNSPS